MSSTASREHYARLQTAEAKALRDFLQGATHGDASRLPGKRALQAEANALAAEFPGLNPTALVDTFTDFARRTASGALTPFAARGHILQVASAVVEKMEAEDRLVPVPEDVSAEDITAATDQAEGKGDWAYEQRARMNADMSAAEARHHELQAAVKRHGAS